MVQRGIKWKRHPRKGEEEIRESEAHFQTLAENIPQLAWMANADGGIFWYNQRWFDFTGTTLEEAQGWGWEKVHHSDHVNRVTDKFRRHMEIGEPWEDTFPLRGKDGCFRWFLSRAFPLRDSEGRITRWFGTNTDITELREAQEALARQAQELEIRVRERTASLDKSLQSFETLLYTIAHDLREPNRAMQGYAQLLMQDYSEKLDDDGRMYLNRISLGALKNERLIRDLLEFGRLAHVEFPCHAINPKPAITAVVTGLEREIQATGATITVAEFWPNVCANDAALSHAFSNLITNALKHVAPGVTPKIDVYHKFLSEATTSGHSGRVRLCVQDNGIGVPRDQHERIFEPFQRASAGSYEATGMGLAIVRKAAERMGGSAGLDSQAGNGSCFWIELALAGSENGSQS